MKKIYITFFFLCSLTSYSQNELIGEWYLDHIIKNGVTHHNYFNDNQVFYIEFTETESGFNDFLEFNMGHGCNASNGIYVLNSNEITIDIVGTTLVDCFPIPHAQYESLFYNEFTYDDGDNTILHTYTMTGVNNDQILTLVNSVSGNTIVYKKVQPTLLLVSTWWLHQIDIPGNPLINIPETDSPNIIFTNTVSDLTYIPETYGTGECEGFFAHYNVTFNGANNISVSGFNETLSACATEAYEGIYFQILGDNTTNFFEFEIVNAGSTLILTDLLGAKLIFGNSTLSIDEQSIFNLDITLKQNPINTKLVLKIDDIILLKELEYQIYTMDGKIVKSSILTQNTIDVSEIQSGIFMINFTKNNLKLNSLKFIKI